MPTSLKQVQHRLFCENSHSKTTPSCSCTFTLSLSQACVLSVVLAEDCKFMDYLHVPTDAKIILPVL